MARSRGKRKKAPDRFLPVWLPLAGLALAVLALFWRSLTGGFLYDSIGEIEQWGFLHDPANLPTVLSFRVMSLDVLDFNRPVELASFMFDSLVWGRHPFGYHLTNVLLHLAVTSLVFLGLRHVLSLGKNPPASKSWTTLSAFLAALLFAIHPLVTEIICEPSNRKDILATLFGLGAFFVILRHRPGEPRGDALRLFLGWLLCLLSIGSKEVGIAFPVLLFLYWLLFRRNEPGRYWAAAIGGSVFVALAFLIARFRLAHHPSEIFVAPPSYPGGSLAQALLIQPCIFVFYLGDLFWPFHFCADENAYSIRHLALAPSLLLLAGVGSGLAWWALCDSRVIFAIGILVASLLPVSNLVPIYHPLADRYLYLPLAAVALLLAVALQAPRILTASSARKAAVALVGTVLLFLASLTWQREAVWSNGISLWTDTLRENPSSYSAHINLPEALLAAGRVPEARAQYERTLRTPYRNAPQILFGYAIALQRLGDTAEARQVALRVVAQKPFLADDTQPDPSLEYSPQRRREFARILAPGPDHR